jgi:hypothetical protein
MWSPLPKTQWRIMILRYSPYDDTPTAATVAVTTCGVSLLSCKKKNFVVVPYYTLRSMAVAIFYLLLRLRWQQWDYRHMGCSDLSNIEAILVLVILLALLKDCSHWKTWFIYSTIRYMDWSDLVHFVLTSKFVYIVNFLSRIFSDAFGL